MHPLTYVKIRLLRQGKRNRQLGPIMALAGLITFMIGYWYSVHLVLGPAWRRNTDGDGFANRYAAAVGATYMGVDDAVLQTTERTCGPATLAFILRHHGQLVTESEVAAAVGITSEGTSLLSLAEVATSYGYEVNGLDVSYDALLQLPMPSLVFMPRQHHFVAITSITPDSVLVADPLVGYLRYTKSSFVRHWDGVVLTVTQKERG